MRRREFIAGIGIAIAGPFAARTAEHAIFQLIDSKLYK
jgi:hypothetical protein